jgi:hypothetical protein
LVVFTAVLIPAGAASASGDHRIEVPATNATVALGFDVTAHGTSAGPVSRVDLTDNTGWVHFGDRIADGLAYAQQPFFEFTLYQVISTEADQWRVLWLYCMGPNLVFIYHESTTGPSGLDDASGSCTANAAPAPPGPGVPPPGDGSPPRVGPPPAPPPPPPLPDTVVHLADTDMRYPKLVDGYDIDGPSLHLNRGGPGSIVIDGHQLVLLPFADVDCSQDCGFPGWYELHTLLWDPARQQATFAILYLIVGTSDSVALHYALTLPTATLVPSLTFTGTHWSVRPEATPTQPDRLVGSSSFVDGSSCADPVQVDWAWRLVRHTYINRDGGVDRIQFTGSVHATYTDLTNGVTRVVDSSGPGTVDLATGTTALRGNNAYRFDQTGTLVDSSGRIILNNEGNVTSVTGHERPVCELLGTTPN